MTVTIDDIKTVVCLQLGLKQVHENDQLIEELGAESADVVNIVAALEEKYRISISEEALPTLRSVADLYEVVQTCLSTESKP
jgi:acyl carrier protein